MADASEPFVIIDNVSKKFNDVYVLREISAEIHPGEILGLIGKSGAGKSVLINMLRGTPEYRPDSGRVIYRFNSCDACGWADLSISFDKVRKMRKGDEGARC